MKRPSRKLREADIIDYMALGSLTVGSLSTLIIFIAYRIGYDFIWWSLLYVVFTSVIMMCLYYMSFFRRSVGIKTAVVGIIVIGIATIAANALQKAVIDRTIEYASAKDLHAWCGKYVILRSVSDNFLAIAPNEARVIIDSECNIKFTLLSGDRYKGMPRSTGQQAITEAWRKAF